MKTRTLKSKARFLSGAVLLGACLIAPGVPAADEFGGIPRGPGVEETYYACSACHSFKLVAQQGLSRERWDEVLVWMVEEQEMEPLEAEESPLILDYLTKYYGPDRLARKMTKK